MMSSKKLAAKLRRELGRLEAELEQFVEFGCEGYSPVEYAFEKAYYEGQIYQLTLVLADVEN